MKVTIIKDSASYDSMPVLFANDYGFTLQFEIKDDEYNAYSLGSNAVLLKMQNLATSSELLSATCTVTNITSGYCEYEFTSSDLLNTSGVFLTELELSGVSERYTVELGRTIVKDNQ